MTSAYSINLNFNNTIPVKTDFTFKQGDKGITLNLATTGLDTTGTEAHIVFKRSNGTSVEAELTGQSGPNYTYTILGNEFEIPGVVVADLKLYDGDTQRLSTASFIFQVTGDTLDGIGGGTGGYSDQLEELSQEFSDTLEEYKDAFGDVGVVNPRGAYDSTADYNVLDLVSYQGSSYLCRTACKNKVPTNTTYWQVFASGGGGGTDDYEDLENKPSINSVTLSGNKTTADLGLFSGNYNDLTNKPTIPSAFNDLTDVDMTGVTDGQVPTWDATAQKYKPGTPSGGGDNAKRVDLTSIIATGSTNTTGAQILTGSYFYLNGVFCRALVDIAVNSTFTKNTNYKETNLNDELATPDNGIPIIGIKAVTGAETSVTISLDSIYFTEALPLFVVGIYRTASVESQDGTMIVKLKNGTAIMTAKNGLSSMSSCSYNSVANTLTFNCGQYMTLTIYGLKQ